MNTMISSIFLIVLVIAILAATTTTAVPTVRAQIITGDPTTDNLLRQTQNMINGMANTQFRDSSWNPPSTQQDLNNICQRQASHFASDVNSFCNDQFNFCVRNGLTVVECYAYGFAQQNTIPNDVLSSMVAKEHATNQRLDNAINSQNQLFSGGCGLLNC